MGIVDCTSIYEYMFFVCLYDGCVYFVFENIFIVFIGYYMINDKTKYQGLTAVDLPFVIDIYLSMKGKFNKSPTVSGSCTGVYN